ncbi:hypothetical protein PVL29_009874 [Vitis rotundifolia]|uniref:PLAC8 motif-containing protein n=1 Tax=Vitis rotundifolia TaxID=103349 RepID=A0AA38ZRW2_VITRO|nr:hypothetical protein PVL29_009874 [Vitis rotundifolia]
MFLPFQHSPITLTTVSIRLYSLQLSSTGRLAPLLANFQEVAEERHEISCSVPYSHNEGLPEHSNVIRAQNCDSMCKRCREWIRSPFNIVFLIWIICVAISGLLLVLIVTGMLNRVLPEKDQRDAWAEVNNQTLNALFTLMSLYQHPKRLHYLVLLCRWKPKDISRLRKEYCKNGTQKPHEWGHMMVVVLLLNVNCISQYALCGLNLGFNRQNRPAAGVGLCIVFAVSSGSIAGLYSNFSPLGKEYESEFDEEVQNQTVTTDPTGQQSRLNARSFEKRFSFVSRNDQRVIEISPQWRGGIFNLWDDVNQAYLSLFCCFCVFGWNMERLGFGNMYVHIATFLLFCVAPFWIFNLAAINVDDERVRQILGLVGIVLCVFGLLYGGFWRIQMRKRFNLPGNNLCCWKPALTDCAQWLCCACCSLAQEVRTANYYDIAENKFYRKQDDNSQPAMPSLPHEDRAIRFSPSSPFLNTPNPSNPWTEHFPTASRLPNYYYYGPDGERPQVENFSIVAKDGMNPPLPAMIQERR